MYIPKRSSRFKETVVRFMVLFVRSIKASNTLSVVNRNVQFIYIQCIWHTHTHTGAHTHWHTTHTLAHNTHWHTTHTGPDLSLTDSSLSTLYVNVSSSSTAEIALSFMVSSTLHVQTLMYYVVDFPISIGFCLSWMCVCVCVYRELHRVVQCSQ